LNLDREDYTIKDFSQAMGMSHSSLYKKIKFISGQTTNAFIRSVRLRRAAVLMLTENITIAETGSKVGIGDPRHFRRQFILLFGMTPSDYIRKYRGSFNKDLNIIQNDLH
jgi:AraC-like DNA-binding protein